MGWGTPRRPKISTKIGRPTPREGSDGDIQIKGTNSGAKFFAKWEGRWLGISDLIKGEEERKDVSTPKIWQYRIEDTSTGTQHLIYLPEFITQANFLTATTSVKLQGLNLWFIWRNGASTEALNAYYHYVMYMDWDNRRLDISGFGSGEDVSWFRCTVLEVNIFFKG